MENKLEKIVIQECKLVSVNFDVRKSFPPNAQVKVTTTQGLEYSYDDSENTLNLIMSSNVTCKDILMNISIRYSGIFKFDQKPTPEEHLNKTAEITCAAILFPFVREFIANLTRQAGFPPLLLDPVNFVEFYNDNHPDQVLKTTIKKAKQVLSKPE